MTYDKSAAALDSALVWFRRDLRSHDHAALYHALRSARRVWCVFVFDRDILEPLRQRGRVADRRVEFIHDSIAQLDEALAALGRQHGHDGVRLLVRHGHAVDEIAALARELHVQAVYANHDDEPAALQRDARVRGVLAGAGIAAISLYDVNSPAAEGLAQRLRTHYPAIEVATGSNDPAGLDLVVNATPMGMNPGDPLPLDVARLDARTFVGEVVMQAEMTAFLTAAQARGCRIQVGSDMLFEQIPGYLEYFGFPTTTAQVLRDGARLQY